MPDELEFDRALELAGNFIINETSFHLRHTKLPNYKIEVDNLAQRGRTVFVFEGKYKRDYAAIKQLKERYWSLMTFKNKYIQEGFLTNYTVVRLFYYSFKRKNIVEFDHKGNKISSAKFNNLNELSKILRNI